MKIKERRRKEQKDIALAVQYPKIAKRGDIAKTCKWIKNGFMEK